MAVAGEDGDDVVAAAGGRCVREAGERLTGEIGGSGAARNVDGARERVVLPLLVMPRAGWLNTDWKDRRGDDRREDEIEAPAGVVVQAAGA